MFGIVLSACQTSAGAAWPAFGVYRLPYGDGIDVYVSNDFVTHDPIGRYDLKGQGGGPYTVVAAAGGWIRIISDQNSGGDEVNNNYVWIEHPYPFCQGAGVTWPGKPADYDDTCIQCLGDFCNEWTKYSHMTTNSTTGDANLSVGDFVQAGAFLGYEGSVGAPGPHVHFQVDRLDPDMPLSDADDGFSYDWSDGGWLASPNLLPHFCGIAGHLDDGETFTAAPCDSSAYAPGGDGKGNLATNVRWTWQGRTVSATGLVRFSGPDQRNQITLSAFSLDRPVSLEGTAMVLNYARLVRPVTFQLDRFGTARIPASQLIFTFDLARELWTSGAKSAATGPLNSGYLNVGYVNGGLSFSFDAAPLGTVAGEARLR